MTDHAVDAIPDADADDFAPDVIVVGSGSAGAAATSDEGLVTITSDYEPDAIHRAIVAAARQCGVPYNPNYNDGEQDGVSFMEFNIKEGVRHSTAVAYLKDVADHPNLRVLLRAQARRLLFAGTRCVGVEWSRDGRTERREAGEALVSGGSIGSPQLLLLSGVGPAEHLREHGLAVIADLPGVGSNLQD